nr:ABC transporter A family member 1 isoform X1 [Tanacetum cinerariifolium]
MEERKKKMTSEKRSSWRQLKAMLRKNWLLKIRHPYITLAEILLPLVVMLMLMAVRTQVDTKIHPAQSYIQKDTFVEVGKSNISPTFDQVLESLLANDEYLAFAPNTSDTRMMINILSYKYPLIKLATKVYKDELELDTYLKSDHYAACDEVKNCSNPKIKGAIVFHGQGPYLYDYSIRLNHTWAFSGFPDVNSIMDINGPYVNDLELGLNQIPILQYGSSGFLTLQQSNSLKIPWSQFMPSTTRLAPFPTREYTDDEFQSIIKDVMGVLYLLGFLFPISRLISYSAFEKEQKIKEGLYMMGLKEEIFHLSWFITYALQFAISSGIITICTMGTLFKYSDKSLVFMYFFVFGLSAIMLSFLISTFFTRAKSAVSVGTLAFLGAFFPYYTVNDEGVSMVLKILASLLSPTAFALGSVNFADYERAHVGLLCFLICLAMMVFDSLLYFAIGLYLDKVLHKENGFVYPWNFIFPKGFWTKRNTIKQLASSVEGNGDSHSKEVCTPSQSSMEAISLDMKQQEMDGRCIQIRNLHKVYNSSKGKCCAVDSLRLTLYENQILALLGHNGAGKSTTISMLVGLLAPTSGDALVFGKSILTYMDDIRKNLGVCPQYDILFPELTVKEHLEIFANIKGVNEESLENSVTEMVDEVGLADKLNTVVSALSGGMKRKLSLGIALIGDSKVVILDEPTSGMDPYSMRLTWQLIKRIKKGRIILLTTHSMDEADVLGDRIAIMANGSLKCCGSSLFLKHQYGVGYTLTLVKTSPGASAAADIVYRHIPSATCVSEVGTEISFKLPLASSASFEYMFREIESCISKADSNLISSGIENRTDFGIESYGISVTTLEEVFLRVAGCDISEEESAERKSSMVIPDPAPPEIFDDYVDDKKSSTKLFGNYLIVLGIMFSTVGRVCTLFLAAALSFLNFVSVHCCCPSFITTSTFWKHTKALLIKRWLSARRDRKTIAFQLLIPAIFLFIGLLLLELKPHPDQPSIIFTTSYFNPLISGEGGGGPIPFDLSLPIAQEVSHYIEGGWIQRFKESTYRFPNPSEALQDAIEAAGPTLGPLLLSMSEYLMSSFNESYESRYGAIVMDAQNDDGSIGYTVLHNSTCQHAAPTFINLMNSAILRLATLNGNMTIQTRNHPLPMTESQRLQRQDLDAFSAAIVVSIAFSFIPASFAVAIVKEREVKAKHQQLISGVSILSYWISTYIWDFISYLVPSSFAMLLFYIFGLEQFIGSGIVLMVISFIMGFIPATQDMNSFLKNFFRLSPGFCFADGLASLALLRQGMKVGSSQGYFGWNVSGGSICYLAAEGIIYFLLTLGLEVFPPHKFSSFDITEFLKSLRRSSRPVSDAYAEPLLSSSTKSDAIDLDEDIDVQTERNRVLSGSIDKAIIYLRNLRKVFPGGRNYSKKVAVHSLTFSVQEGECFGFLGTNGAGKTTTLSMLSGEVYPSDGTAFIFGQDMRLNPKAARQLIGYCPQFDALLEFLTVQEHLELYARIKGVPDYMLDNVVMDKLLEFDLLRHASKQSFTLSGGNKRKLSVAIAMIGDPPIVFLDEPSTGMDPIAKRFMWEVISRLSTRSGKTAVILTTHSMNEAQALCTRIGIMVGGKLRCIGSPQHLKTRFGNHLELEVKPTEVSSVDLENLCQMIQERLFDIPSHPRGIFGDLEVCIRGPDSITSEDASATEISLSREMIILIGRWLGNEERIRTLTDNVGSSGALSEQLPEQLARDGGLPLPIFSEWWLAKEKFSVIDSFVLASFPGATSQGSNGLSVKYQLPRGEDFSLADVFGLIERNRNQLGIAEYSISQSTLETIFSHFAANA